MQHDPRSIFLALWAIDLSLSSVYGQSLSAGQLTNVVSPTFGGSAGDTLFCRFSDMAAVRQEDLRVGIPGCHVASHDEEQVQNRSEGGRVVFLLSRADW